MERRAAGALLALAACLACTAAAPTASNHTSLDLYDGAPEGCYYNFQHYGEGDRIMTNEPCLNCTCHNRMLMCYLRVCPFTKPIGQDCTVEKRADQCCPIVTCPDVPVDLLTSTSTTSPEEYGATGVGKLDKYGCSFNGKYLPEGAKVPSSPDKPCEHCYCFRNVTNCIMQECTLHVDGCTPIYHREACCPVRYSCDHPDDETLMLDDMTTTVRPTPGFLLTTTTVSSVTQMTQDCIHDDKIFADGALIKTEKACEHCYCMKGDIVCVVQECGTPMENEGKNCTSLSPREGQCCPDTYICEGDEPSSTELISETSKEDLSEEKTTTLTPKRTSIEGSGYRNEPDDSSFIGISTLEPDFEGSGDDVATRKPDDVDENIIDDHSRPQLFDENVVTDDSFLSSSTPSGTASKETTEPDKGLNTVPLSDEDIVEHAKPETTTLSNDIVTEKFRDDSSTTEITRRNENDLGQDDALPTVSNIYLNEEIQSETTTISSDAFGSALTTLADQNQYTSEKEEISTKTPVKIDMNTNKEDQPTPTNPTKIKDLHHETSTTSAMDDVKVDVETNQPLATTINEFNYVTKDEEKTEATTGSAMNIVKEKDENVESEKATTANPMKNMEQDQENIGSVATTVSATLSSKDEGSIIKSETPTFGPIDSVKEGEEMPHSKFTTINSLESVKDDDDQILSEITTESILNGIENEITTVQYEATTKTASGNLQRDGEKVQLEATTVGASDDKNKYDESMESEVTTESAFDNVSKGMAQSEATTQSNIDDEEKTQFASVTISTMDIKKEEETTLLDATTESVMRVKEDEAKFQPEKTTLSVSDDTKKDADKINVEQTTASAFTDKNNIRPETTTYNVVNVKKDGSNIQSEVTTVIPLDSSEKGEGMVQSEVTTQSDLINAHEDKLEQNAATKPSSLDNEKVTTVNPFYNDEKDEELTQSKTTTTPLDSGKGDEETIQSEATTVVTMLDVEDETTHSILDGIKTEDEMFTTERIKTDEESVQSGSSTVSNTPVFGETTVNVPSEITTQTAQSSDNEDVDNIKSEATTAKSIESTKVNIDQTASEATTASTIPTTKDDEETLQSEATTQNDLDTVKEHEQSISSEASTARPTNSDTESDENLSEFTTTSTVDTYKHDEEHIESVDAATTVSIIDGVKVNQETIMFEATTAKTVENVKQDEKIEPEAMITTALDGVKQVTEKVESEATTHIAMLGVENDKESNQIEASTLTAIESDKELEENIPMEATTVIAIDSAKEDEENIDSDITNQSGLSEEKGEKEKLDSEVTTVSFMHDVKPDDEKTESESSTKLNVKQKEEEIISQITTTAAIDETKTDKANTYYETSTKTTVDSEKEVEQDQSETTPESFGNDLTSSEVSTSVSPSIETKLQETTTVTHAQITTEFLGSPETSSINPVENEIDEDASPILPPGRIPGEGDCLLNAITYKNDSAIPNVSKCQSNCRCFSSIIKCDPIICSQPPENMDNCQPIYDSDDSCCPSYTCDQTKETIPPQSHSQMSGTESPAVTSNKICDGENCHTSNEEQSQKPSISSEIPKLCSGNECFKPKPDEVIPSCNGNECGHIQPPISTEQPQSCQGSECQQELQIQPCDDDKCLPEQPVDSSCKGDTCDSSSVQPHKALVTPVLPSCEGKSCGETETHHKEEEPLCSDETGCKKPSEENLQSECAGTNCRRVEIEQVSTECFGNECTQKVPEEKDQETETPNKMTTEAYSDVTAKVNEEQSSANLDKTEHQLPQSIATTLPDIPDRTDNLSETYSTTSPNDEKTQTASHHTTVADFDSTESFESIHQKVTDMPVSINDISSTTFISTSEIEQIEHKTETPKTPATEESEGMIDSHDISTIEPFKETEADIYASSDVHDSQAASTESIFTSHLDDATTAINDKLGTTAQEELKITYIQQDKDKSEIESSTLPAIFVQEKISTKVDFDDLSSTTSDMKEIDAEVDKTTKAIEYELEKETTKPASTMEFVTKGPQLIITDSTLIHENLETTPVPEIVKDKEDTHIPTTDSTIISEHKPTESINDLEKITTTLQPESLHTTTRNLVKELTDTTKQVSDETESMEPQKITSTSSTIEKEYMSTLSPMPSGGEKAEKSPQEQIEVGEDLPQSTESSTILESERDSTKITSPAYLQEDYEITTEVEMISDQVTTNFSEETSEQAEIITKKFTSENPLSTVPIADAVTLSPATIVDDEQAKFTKGPQEEIVPDTNDRTTTEKIYDDQLPEIHTNVPEVNLEHVTSLPEKIDDKSKETETDQTVAVTQSPQISIEDKEPSTPIETITEILETETEHQQDKTVTTDNIKPEVLESTTEKLEEVSDKIKPDSSVKQDAPEQVATNIPDSLDNSIDDNSTQTPDSSQEKVTNTMSDEMEIESTTLGVVPEKSSELPEIEKTTVSDSIDFKHPTTTDTFVKTQSAVSEKVYDIPVSVTNDTILQTGDTQNIIKESEPESEVASPLSTSTETLTDIITISTNHPYTSDDKSGDSSEEHTSKKTYPVDTDTQDKTTVKPDSTVREEDSSESTTTEANVVQADFTKLETTNYSYEETTPYLVELEEHTHKIIEESSTAGSPQYDELTTAFNPSEIDSSTAKQTSEAQTIEGDLIVSVPTVETSSELITSGLHDESTEKSTSHTTTEDNKLSSQTTSIKPASEVSNETEKPTLLEKDEMAHVTSDLSSPGEEFLPVTKATTKTDEEVFTQQSPMDTVTKIKDNSSETTTQIAVQGSQKPTANEVQPTDELPSPDYEAHLPTSGTSGYGQEPDYVEEDQAFGPGTCRYGGKVYVSAQQIPRDDPCDFCFCFRSDIICLQQSCPPPIQGCHEEPIQGFCCPRYECPVAMATTLNMTTTTTTTTTTLPPHFPTHAYSGSAQRRGCQIKGHIYKVGEVVKASSGPCLHCTCGGDGQMKCDPKVCTPEPMLRQMIAAAVSAKRRR